MSKLIEERLTEEYPGIVRTITVFEDDIIEIEFNLPCSNEIGIRFRKSFTDPKAENILLKAYYASPRLPSGAFDHLTEAEIGSSWIKLVRDVLEDRVLLPDGGKGYELKDKRSELRKWLS